MQTISVSDIQRNLHKLDGFNIVEIVDKKRHKTKGYFLDTSYKPLIESLVRSEKEQKEGLLRIAGVINDGADVTRDALRDERLARYE